MKLTIDSREPDPHPWIPFLPAGWTFEVGGLEAGDLICSRLPDGLVVERKGIQDMASCVGSSRERFERELRRGRYCGRFLVVVEGTLGDVCSAARGMHHSSIVGSIAAWTARYCPFVFAGSVAAAADFSFRALASQVRDIERAAKALEGDSRGCKESKGAHLKCDPLQQSTGAKI
jgi:ERCC4-type nuclease